MKEGRKSYAEHYNAEGKMGLLYRKEKELRKKKVLEWAKLHGCYEEIKRYYEMKEWVEKHVVY